MIEQAVKPTVMSFLKERGLTLSPEKTKIISVRSSEHINFLGYTFQYFPMIKPKYKLFHDRLGKEGIACYPQRKKYEALIEKLRLIIKKAYNKTAYELIRELNPIIRGWCMYFNLSQSYQTRNLLSARLYHLLTKWAMRKHPRWGKRRIAKFYFLRTEPEVNKIDSEQDYNFGPKPLKWVFHGQTRNPSIYNNFSDGKRIDLLNPTRVVPTISAREFRLPKKLELVHAFHPQYMELVEHNAELSHKIMKESGTLKSKLFTKQKRLCSLCGDSLLDFDGEIPVDGALHIHHKNPRALGGSKFQIQNLALVHAECHKTHQHHILPKEKGK